MEKYDSTDLKTYVVWLPMLPTDAREKWPPALISDRRARHFWDGKQVIGRWFTDNVKSCDTLGPVAWDAYYLYGRDAKWEDALDPALSCGTPVIKATEPLAAALENVFPDEK